MSSAVRGCPSDHFMPSFIFIVAFLFFASTVRVAGPVFVISKFSSTSNILELKNIEIISPS